MRTRKPPPEVTLDRNEKGELIVPVEFHEGDKVIVDAKDLLAQQRESRQRIAELEAELETAREVTRLTKAEVERLTAQIETQNEWCAADRTRAEQAEARLEDQVTLTNQALSLADSVRDDCQRAIARADRLAHELRCLQESTVDAKAYEQVQARLAEVEAAYEVLVDAASAAHVWLSKLSGVSANMNEQYAKGLHKTIRNLFEALEAVDNEPSDRTTR